MNTYTREKLEIILGIKYPTIDLYLYNQQLSHIKRIKRNKQWYYENVEPKDIKFLKELVRIRKNRRNL